MNTAMNRHVILFIAIALVIALGGVAFAGHGSHKVPEVKTFVDRVLNNQCPITGSTKINAGYITLGEKQIPICCEGCVEAWNDVKDEYKAEAFALLESHGVKATSDTTPPVITKAAPIITTMMPLTAFTIVVSVNEPAECRNSGDSTLTYDKMPASQMGLQTSHAWKWGETSFDNTWAGKTSDSYIKCKDAAGNIGSLTYSINFAASQSGGGGVGTTKGYVILSNAAFKSVIDSYIHPITGENLGSVIIQGTPDWAKDINKRFVVLDLGTRDDIKIADNLGINHDEEIIHPITGENLGGKVGIGIVQVVWVSEKLSVAEIVSTLSGESIVKLDRVAGSYSSQGASGAAQQKGGITGTVVGKDGNPLEGVGIRLYMRIAANTAKEINSIYTDSNGAYTFIGLEAGTYELRLSKFDIDKNLKSGIIVNPAQITPVESIKLTGNIGKILGSVKSGDNYLHNIMAEIVGTQISEKTIHGSLLMFPPSGTYTLKFSGNGYETLTKENVVVREYRTTLIGDVQLKAAAGAQLSPGNIEGRILPPTAKFKIRVVENEKFNAYSDGYIVTSTVQPSPTGKFQIKGIPTGSYTLEFSDEKKEFKLFTQHEVEVRSGQTTNIQFSMVPKSSSDMMSDLSVSYSTISGGAVTSSSSSSSSSAATTTGTTPSKVVVTADVPAEPDTTLVPCQALGGRNGVCALDTECRQGGGEPLAAGRTSQNPPGCRVYPQANIQCCVSPSARRLGDAKAGIVVYIGGMSGITFDIVSVKDARKSLSGRLPNKVYFMDASTTSDEQYRVTFKNDAGESLYEILYVLENNQVKRLVVEPSALRQKVAELSDAKFKLCRDDAKKEFFCLAQETSCATFISVEVNPQDTTGMTVSECKASCQQQTAAQYSCVYSRFQMCRRTQNGVTVYSCTEEAGDVCQQYGNEYSAAETPYYKTNAECTDSCLKKYGRSCEYSPDAPKDVVKCEQACRQRVSSFSGAYCAHSPPSTRLTSYLSYNTVQWTSIGGPNDYQCRNDERCWCGYISYSEQYLSQYLYTPPPTQQQVANIAMKKLRADGPGVDGVNVIPNPSSMPANTPNPSYVDRIEFCGLKVSSNGEEIISQNGCRPVSSPATFYADKERNKIKVEGDINVYSDHCQGYTYTCMSFYNPVLDCKNFDDYVCDINTKGEQDLQVAKKEIPKCGITSWSSLKACARFVKGGLDTWSARDCYGLGKGKCDDRDIQRLTQGLTELIGSQACQNAQTAALIVDIKTETVRTVETIGDILPDKCTSPSGEQGRCVSENKCKDKDGKEGIDSSKCQRGEVCCRDKPKPENECKSLGGKCDTECGNEQNGRSTADCSKDNRICCIPTKSSGDKKTPTQDTRPVLDRVSSGFENALYGYQNACRFLNIVEGAYGRSCYRVCGKRTYVEGVDPYKACGGDKAIVSSPPPTPKDYDCRTTKPISASDSPLNGKNVVISVLYSDDPAKTPTTVVKKVSTGITKGSFAEEIQLPPNPQGSYSISVELERLP